MEKIQFKDKWLNKSIANNNDVGIITLESATIGKQAVVVAYSTSGFLILYDVLTGKEICRSAKLDYNVQLMQLTKFNGELILVVCLKNSRIEKYTLPNLEKTGVSFILGMSAATNLQIVHFENKIQLLAEVEHAKICTWDFETGEPIHQPLEIYYINYDEEEDEEWALNGDIELTSRFFYVDNQPFLGVNVNQCDNAFLWNMNEAKHVGEFDLFDDKIQEYIDEHMYTYDIYDIHPVNIDGENQYLTISTSGIFAFFDSKDFSRVGPIKETEILAETFKVFSYKSQQIIAIASDSTFYLFDLKSLEIIKEISFEQNITAYTIYENYIVVAYDGELIAYEMK